MEKTSRGKKTAFTVLGLTLAGLALELGSFLVLSAVSGRMATWSATRSERSAIAEPASEEARGATIARELLAQSVIHPFLGYVRDPDSVELGNFNEEAQAFGFIQNRSRLFHKPSPERLVVAVTGGSVARSVAVHGDALRRALSKSRRFAGRKVTVLSLAIGGYKQPQQLIVLNYFLSLGAHFDVVVNLDGFNDVVLAPSRNVPDGTFPFFPFRWPDRVGELDLDERRLVGELTYLRSRRRDWSVAFEQGGLRHSMTGGTGLESFRQRLGQPHSARRRAARRLGQPHQRLPGPGPAA